MVWYALPLHAATVRGADCVVIATEHSGVDYGMICREARAVVDSRNALARYVKS